MQARRYKHVMLIALFFTAAGLMAQSARRPAAQESKERESRTVRTTRAASPEPDRAYGMKQDRRPESIANPNNRRSPERIKRVSVSEARYSAPVGSKAYNNRAYYAGNHYHYVYPTRRVKIHHHHNTYVNSYHVLYYPAYSDIYWTRSMYRDYHRWYPGYRWNYSYGYRIRTISIWDARYNLGEVAMVYGRVYATWHNRETDDYLLFFGGEFPRQQFTAVVPGKIARRFSWRPEKFFLGEHVTATGLITTYDGSPEIVIRHRTQLAVY